MSLDQPDAAADAGTEIAARRKRQLYQLLSMGLTLSLTIAAMVGTLFVARSPDLSPPGKVHADEVRALVNSDQANIAQLQSTLNDLRKNQEKSQELVDKLTKAQPATLQVARLGTELDSLQAQMNQLDDAIGQSPEKALAIPLLKKDMDDFKDTYRRDMDSTQGEINRVYDQNKWFIGLMFTIALAILGLTVTNFLQVRKQ